LCSEELRGDPKYHKGRSENFVGKLARSKKPQKKKASELTAV
jgi:hypothetical protein